MTTNTPRIARTTIETSRLLDFASRKELIAQIGHQPKEWPLVVLKELVDNSLDACEEADTVPEINIKVDNDGIHISDNGPGIPEATIDGVLNFAIRVSSREAYVAPDRGAQGNALKTIVAMPCVLDGESGHITIDTGGTRHKITMSVDRVAQKPVLDRTQEPGLVKNGTLVTVHWPDLACSILENIKTRFLQIANDYTWLNPHLTLNMDWFGEHWCVEATDQAWKKWRPSDPTCPAWYQLEHFERLIAGYISHDADRNTDRTVREVVAEFRGLTGTAKQKRVLDESGLSRTNLSALRNGRDLRHDITAKLLGVMKTHSKPVKPKALGIIGQDHLKARFEILDCAMESFQYKKIQDTTDDIPWIIETAFGYIPSDDAGRRLVTGVNWSPGIINPFRSLGRYGVSCDTILERQRISEDDPVILVLHMACPRVEYTDRGKSAVVLDGDDE